MCHQECHQRSADRLLQLCAVNGGVFVKVGGLRTDFNKISLKEKIIASVGLKVIKNILQPLPNIAMHLGHLTYYFS